MNKATQHPLIACAARTVADATWLLPHAAGVSLPGLRSMRRRLSNHALLTSTARPWCSATATSSGLLWERNAARLCLRVGKNDVWELAR